MNGWRNVTVLTASLALGQSGASMVVLLGGILSVELAPSPSLATLPISLMIVGVALTTLPAAALMKRVGRRRGFILAAFMAGLAAMLAAYAVFQASFGLFCVGTLLIGANGAFIQHYRFAATESVPPASAGRAVSIVLLGGVLAGIIGPEVGRRSVGLIPGVPITGSFISLAGLYFLVIVLMLFFRDVRPEAREAAGPERPLREIAANPIFPVAVLAGAISYGVMSLIMTATPIQLHTHQGFSLDSTALVIQSHVIAMYLPSLFTGFLIERFGVLRVMLMGIGAMLACVALSVLGNVYGTYWAALVFLGIGWNFLFVGATVLLTRSYHPAERFKAQGVNDFTVFGTQALASLSAGTLLFLASWDVLNLLSVPLLLLTFLVVLLLNLRRQLELAGP